MTVITDKTGEKTQTYQAYTQNSGQRSLITNNRIKRNMNGVGSRTIC
jgi:hypothetical protein